MSWDHWWNRVMYGNEPLDQKDYNISHPLAQPVKSLVDHPLREPDYGQLATPVCGYRSTDVSFHDTVEAAHEASQRYAKAEQDKLRREAKQKAAIELTDIAEMHMRNQMQSYNSQLSTLQQQYNQLSQTRRAIEALVDNPERAIVILQRLIQT